MEVQKPATAGTLESSDAQVVVEPFADGIQLSIESSVMSRYSRQIKATVLEALERLDVKNGKVTVNDKGALKYALKTRVEYTVFRNCGVSEKDIPQGGVIRWSKD